MTEHIPSTGGSSPKRSIKAVFALIVLIALLGMFEVGARIAYVSRDSLNSLFRTPKNLSSSLDSYETVDSDNPNNWVLRKSVSKTLAELIEDKGKHGRVLYVDFLREDAQKLAIQENDTIFSINSDGYKGPEIDKSHSSFRILTIGDSCTFGSPFGYYTYPRVLERELRNMGKSVEVINVGVEGYSPRHVLYRIEEFKKLKPELTTIYIGWNAIYAMHYPSIHKPKVYTIWFLRKAFISLKHLIEGDQKTALKQYNKTKIPDPDAPKVTALENYMPPFLHEVEEIIIHMKSVGSKVVIVTLPGIFRFNENPSQEAMRKGHLPPFTDNPFVLAKISQRYNEELRNLSDKHSTILVDLESWAEKNLNPSSNYFFDSVHLYSEGQAMIGQHMAKELSVHITEF